jgi:uracil-DNA glycosylase
MNWNDIIKNEQEKSYFKELNEFLDNEYKIKKIYPPKHKIYNAFDLTPLDDLKVVILGQDPYHGANQAQGLAFSTPSEVKNPPSLRNILKEIEDEYNTPSKCQDGDLTPWAKQGVLLINTVLTVEEAKPKSHEKIGWLEFSDNIIRYINQEKDGIIFVLWGAPAIKKAKLIDESKHYILTSPHPSPLSSYRGFFGCVHFKKINEILESMGKDKIEW